MPTYQFRCLTCSRRFEVVITYAEYGSRLVRCAHCTSENVQRRIGRIRIARSEDSRIDDFANPGNLDGMDDDPRAMGKMLRKMSHEMGEDLGPEFSEVIGRLESGESPESIEKAIPDLGGEPAGGDGFGDGFGADF
jgi:putative FmdB family regulatory protein